MALCGRCCCNGRGRGCNHTGRRSIRFRSTSSQPLEKFVQVSALKKSKPAQRQFKAKTFQPTSWPNSLLHRVRFQTFLYTEESSGGKSWVKEISRKNSNTNRVLLGTLLLFAACQQTLTIVPYDNSNPTVGSDQNSLSRWLRFSCRSLNYLPDANHAGFIE